ncbi:MAG: GlsB/YeaQ/YmgE family stress response membrane protein [Rhodoferax sp.]|uniref:GlsB/YeaQ/YmgE family stress response membrane protein n=1 Tax=Rhodoferax sp. TaxID=50421 RepID=UPI00326683F0
MFSLIGTVIVGFVIGLIARAIKPGDDKLGLIMTSVLGIAGSFGASFVGEKMGWYAPGAPAGWIASVVGAIVLLAIYGMVAKK